MACVDMALEISERALEVVRGQIEAAAAAAKEAASHSLLRELEEEAAQQATSKKVLAACAWRTLSIIPLQHDGI